MSASLRGHRLEYQACRGAAPACGLPLATPTRPARNDAAPGPRAASRPTQAHTLTRGPRRPARKSDPHNSATGPGTPSHSDDRRHRRSKKSGAPGVVRQRGETPTERNGAARPVAAPVGLHVGTCKPRPRPSQTALDVGGRPGPERRRGRGGALGLRFARRRRDRRGPHRLGPRRARGGAGDGP